MYILLLYQIIFIFPLPRWRDFLNNQSHHPVIVRTNRKTENTIQVITMFPIDESTKHLKEYPPHCNERDHWIDECPVRKRDLFAELQARNEVKYGTEEAKKRMMKIRNEKLAEKKRQKRKKQPTVQN